MHFYGETLADLYTQIRPHLLDTHAEVAPRGLCTRELTPVSMTLLNPRARLFHSAQRGFSLPFAIAEAAYLFRDTHALAPLDWVNPRMVQFSDDGVSRYGAYGPRVEPQLARILKKLRVDPATRQAIITVHHNEDLSASTVDLPCTLSLHFLLRQNKLSLHTYMRSNDFYWGWPYDVFQFTLLQEVLANELECDLGSYHHTASSFHVYERHFSWLSSIRDVTTISCQLPLLIDDMTTLSHYIHHLAQGGAIVEDESPLHQSMNAFARKKRNVPQPTPALSWAEPFFL